MRAGHGFLPPFPWDNPPVRMNNIHETQRKTHILRSEASKLQKISECELWVSKVYKEFMLLKVGRFSAIRRRDLFDNIYKKNIGKTYDSEI